MYFIVNGLSLYMFMGGHKCNTFKQEKCSTLVYHASFSIGLIMHISSGLIVARSNFNP